MLSEEELKAIYNWVDTFQLSRPKRNIGRDFSDAVLAAEIVFNYFPALVELHNYPSVNSVQQKEYNWKTLNSSRFSLQTRSSKLSVPDLNPNTKSRNWLWPNLKLLNDFFSDWNTSLINSKIMDLLLWTSRSLLWVEELEHRNLKAELLHLLVHSVWWRRQGEIQSDRQQRSSKKRSYRGAKGNYSSNCLLPRFSRAKWPKWRCLSASKMKNSKSSRIS